MNKEIKLLDRFLPKYSLFGFKVLNRWQSIFSAYILIFFELMITPYFNYDGEQIEAGIFFIILNNISIFILLINSLVRIRKLNILLLFDFPLIIFSPTLLKKIYISLYYLKEVYI